MEDETFEHPTNICWVPFAGKKPANNILYNILWIKEDERRARIVNPAEKIMVSAGIEPMTSRLPAPKPLNHAHLLILRAYDSSIWLNLLWLNYH